MKTSFVALAAAATVAALAFGCGSGSDTSPSGAGGSGTGGSGTGGGSCPAKQTDCGGACIDTTKAHDNCGACAHACGSDESCSSSKCVAVCPSGQVSCDGSCVTLSDDHDNCGKCGTACSAGEVCNAGKCASSCSGTQADCNGSCVDGQSDNLHCGATGNCTGANAGMACTDGQSCLMGTCALGCAAPLVLCNNACVDPNNDPTHCGATGDCMGANAGTACTGGDVCSSGMCVVSCPGDQINCNGNCITPSSDPMYCGATGDCQGANAGMDCGAGESCNGGSCGPTCALPLVACGDACVDPQNDPGHCGATGDCQGMNAGAVCTGGDVCVAGGCAVACPDTQIDCGGSCVDPSTDNAHCGASGDCTGADKGAQCGSGQVCSGGVCGATCALPLIACSGACIDPNDDPKHCGASGACTGATAGTDCTAEPHVAVSDCHGGTCGIDTCAVGFGNCDGNAANGCETATTSDNNNCGGCGIVCPATTACVSSLCMRSVGLVEGNAPATYYTDVQQNLAATNAFTTVDILDAHTTTPTLQTLEKYTSLLVVTDGGGFSDPNALGNNVADYYDAGGHVVIAVFANASIPITGRFGTVANGYMLINPAGQEEPTDSLGTKLEPASPLLVGVNTLNCTACYRSTGLAINGGVVVAQWGSGAPLIVRGTVGGRQRVDVNFYPPSDSATTGRADFWTGDGAVILKNALNF